MRQQVRIDAIQLTRLAKSLLACSQEHLDLTVQGGNVCQ